MKAEIIPDWLLTGNIWQMICGLATEGGDRVAGAAGMGGLCWVLTCVGVEKLSMQNLVGLACCSVLEAGDVGV